MQKINSGLEKQSSRQAHNLEVVGASPTPATKSKPFKLKAPRVLESDRQSQIIDWLGVEQAAGRVSWFCRTNGGAVMAGKRFVRFYSLHLKGIAPASKGYADIHGMLPGGRYFALEVKQPGEKATPEQRAFLDAVAMDGGIAAVVYGFEDVEKVLRATKNPPMGGILAPVTAG